MCAHFEKEFRQSCRSSFFLLRKAARAKKRFFRSAFGARFRRRSANRTFFDVRDLSGTVRAVPRSFVASVVLRRSRFVRDGSRGSAVVRRAGRSSTFAICPRRFARFRRRSANRAFLGKRGKDGSRRTEPIRARSANEPRRSANIAGYSKIIEKTSRKGGGGERR